MTAAAPCPRSAPGQLACEDTLGPWRSARDAALRRSRRGARPAVRVLRPGVDGGLRGSGDIQDLPVIPDRPGQQRLQPVRTPVPDRLGDAPAVAVLQLHQQPDCHLTGGLAGLPPRNTSPPARTGLPSRHQNGHQIAWQRRLPLLDCLSRFIMTAAAALLPPGTTAYISTCATTSRSRTTAAY
jgi:hypothetical protein